MRLPAALLLALLAAPAAAQTWSELTPGSGPAPSPRRHAGVVHDPVGHRLVVFGGEGATGRLDDIWAFDLTAETWSDLTPATGPAPRRTPSMVYDPDGHRVLMWSGQSGGTFFDDVWSFDLATETWSEFTPPAPIPGRRYGTVSVYDPVDDDLVTFGGFTFQGRFEDTWRFDPVADTWTEVTPGVSPLKRCLHSAAYDSRDHRMVMYGGQNAGPLDDVWLLDLATHTWTDVTPATRPDGRFFAAHVYDANHHRSVLFGGNRGSAGGGLTNEVWLFNLHNLSFLAVAPGGTPPSPREGAQGIPLPAGDRMVVFGGYDGNYLDEVWALEGLSDTITTAPIPLRGPVLHPNRPNPFNPQTTLTFELPTRTTVTLRIYDAAGRPVRTLVDGARDAGPHEVEWDGRDRGGLGLASGTYFARLESGGTARVRKLVLVR